MRRRQANIRRLLLIGLAIIAAVLSLSGQDGAPKGAGAPYDVWTTEQLRKPGNLGDFGNHASSVQRRETGAAPEVHDGFSHILMFTDGAGTFIVGGEIVDEVRPAPGTAAVTYFITNINVDKP